MILQKKDVTYKLTDNVQIAAFKNSGWSVIDENDYDRAQRKHELETMTIEALREYAAQHSIVIGSSVTKKDDIISLILASDVSAEN